MERALTVARLRIPTSARLATWSSTPVGCILGSKTRPAIPVIVTSASSRLASALASSWPSIDASKLPLSVSSCRRVLVMIGGPTLRRFDRSSRSAARTTALTVTSAPSCWPRINSSKVAGTGVGAGPWRSKVIFSLRTSGLKSASVFPRTRMRSPGTSLVSSASTTRMAAPPSCTNKVFS